TVYSSGDARGERRGAAIRSRYQPDDALGVRCWVSKLTCTTPNRWWQPLPHPKRLQGMGSCSPMMTQYLRVRRASRPLAPSRSRHRPPGVLVAPAQNAQFWTARVLIGRTPMDAHNDSSLFVMSRAWEGGGFAAAAFRGVPRRVRGRSSGVKGACASRCARAM